MPESSQFGERDFGRLSALLDELPSRRIALVRRLWPRISPALDAGHNLVVVHQRLAEDGLDIPYSTLAACVHRIRLERTRSLPTRARRAEMTTDKRAHPPQRLTERDPLANLKKYGTESLRRFDYPGEPPDPKKLF